mgnify:CR=1 FL=1
MSTDRSNRECTDSSMCPIFGLTPQSSNMFGGFRVQGKSEEAAKELIEAAQAVEKREHLCLFLEGIPEKLAAIITKKVHIPTIGIGASAECDGQVLVYQDMLAMYGKLRTKICKTVCTSWRSDAGSSQRLYQCSQRRNFPWTRKYICDQ